MKAIATSILLVLAAGAASAAPADPSFCTRLAPQIGLKPTSNPAMWQGRLISALKGAFIGGTASIGFGVEPVADTPIADEATLRKACTMAKGDFRCVVDRPMILTVSSNKGDGRVEAKPGEKALVETKGVRVRCTDGVTA